MCSAGSDNGMKMLWNACAAGDDQSTTRFEGGKSIPGRY